MNKMYNKAAFLAAFVVLAILTIVVLTSCTSASSAPAQGPVNLTGHWHQTDSGIPEAQMSAEITDNHIVITLEMGHTKGTYWSGTFDASSPDPAFTFVSTGDLEIMKSSLFGSGESSKKFTYENGDITYEFSIMDISTVVHLSK